MTRITQPYPAPAAAPGRGPAADPSPPPTGDGPGRSRLRYAAIFLLVVAVAVALRAAGIDTWSLWEDEEGSIALAQEPFQGFQGFFPVFFVLMKPYLAWVDYAVGAARAVPAGIGVLSIVLAMTGFRPHVSRGTALLAGLFLAVNLGHVFFSQSVRYYTLVLAFEVLAVGWFFDGFESARPGRVALSLVAFVAALLTHFSALLLGPVFVGYLVVAAAAGERGAGYRPRWYAAYGVAFAAVFAVFTWRMFELRGMIAGFSDGAVGIPAQRDAAHVGTTVLAYFGVPLIALGCAAPWLAGLPRRALWLLLTAAGVPVLELLTLAGLDLINVTWYYGFVGLVGFALLAAASLTGLWRRGRTAAAATLAVLTLGYYAAFLAGYYTTMHGDRPRWAEGAAVVRDEGGVRPGNTDNPPVYSGVPGVIDFHLGARPRLIREKLITQLLPARPGGAPAGSWFVVEAKTVAPEYGAWFAHHCALRARFEAKTGPVDRSVLVYYYPGPRPD